MDTIYYIAVAGGSVLVFFLLNRGGRRAARRSSSPKHDNRPTATPPPLKTRPAPKEPERQPVLGTSRPFSEATSSPVVLRTVLRGKAYVVDGDTIRIQKTQIRLFGVDAPEMNHPFGSRAKWALVELCKGRHVHAEVTAIDDHGRTVAKCTLDDGRDLSAEMVKLGLALDWPKFSGGCYERFETADARKKLWLADARQKGRMHVWDQFEARQRNARN